MGDPECQVILPRLNSDIVKIFKAISKNKIKKMKIQWKKTKSMTIVLATRGYPGKYKKNSKIDKINKIKINKNSFIYHAGTIMKKNCIYSNGGRVLNITSSGKTFKKIRGVILKIISNLKWKDGYFRKDIGWRIIK